MPPATLRERPATGKRAFPYYSSSSSTLAKRRNTSAGTSERYCYLLSLPPELLQLIFGFVTPANFIPFLRLVCRQFNAVLEDDLFWKRVNERTFANVPPTESGRPYEIQSWAFTFRDNFLHFKKSFPAKLKDPLSAKGPRQLPPRLSFAARYGYSALVEGLLRDLAPASRAKVLNTWIKQGDTELRATPLFLAAQHGHTTTVERLCQLGSDPNSPAPDNDATALFVAASAGHDEVVRVLKRYGAELDRWRKDGASPLLVATRRGHIKVVKALIELGCDINLTRFNGLSAIYLSVVKGDPEMVRMILNAGAKAVNMTGGATLPFVAAYCGHNATLNVLFDHGLSPNARNSDGATPAYAAAYKGEVEVLATLLARGADLNLARDDGKTPLAVAVQCKRIAATKWLVAHGVDINKAQNDGSSPLFTAVRTQAVDLVRALLTTKSPNHVINVNQPRFDGVAAINVVAQNGDPDIARLLLEHGANPNQEVFQGLTPIIIASDKGHLEVVKALLKHGAEVNHRTNDGTTSLYLAAQRGFEELVKVLLEAGADPNLARVKNEGALHAAAFRGHTSIVSMLLNAGANPSIMREDGVTPLILAVHVGREDVTKILLEAGAIVEAPLIRNNATPLTYAAAMGRLDITAQLLCYGANPFHTLKDGKTSAVTLLGPQWEYVKHHYYQSQGHPTVIQDEINATFSPGSASPPSDLELHSSEPLPAVNLRNSSGGLPSSPVRADTSEDL